MYRSAAAPNPPRVLVVHPQRAPTSVVLGLLGALFTVLSGVATVRALLEGQVGAAALAGLGVAAFGGMFVLAGLHGWLLRVELALYDDGVLTMTWTRWPFARRFRALTAADVRAVEVETDDGTSKIVVCVGEERLPLTSSATSDDLDGKAAEMRAFLGLDA